MANKKISLNIGERVAAVGILNNYQGDLDKLVVILDDIKKFSITEEEWKKAELKYTNDAGATYDNEKDFRKSVANLPKEQQVGRMIWDDEKGGEKEIEIEAGTADYLREKIKEKNDKKEMTINDKALITLRNKLV